MADKKRQKPTLTTTTPAQELAIDVLASGGTTTDAADAADVTRQTVSKWRNHHPGFKAELNTRRRELNHERADRIRDLDAQALATVAEAIDDGNVGVALAWVKSRKLHAVDVDAIGPTDADAMVKTRAAKIRSLPENTDDLLARLDEGQYLISMAEAQELAETELLNALE